MGNNSLDQVSLIERFKFTTAFGNEWEDRTVDAAVLNEITHLKHEDLTTPIQKVLQCLEKHKPQIMIEYGHIFKLENFQTSRTQGDVDLLLGIERISMHPRPLIVFKQDIIISLIRQPVKNNKFLLLAGTTSNIDDLDGKMEVHFVPDTVEHYHKALKGSHITVRQLQYPLRPQ